MISAESSAKCSPGESAEGGRSRDSSSISVLGLRPLLQMPAALVAAINYGKRWVHRTRLPVHCRRRLKALDHSNHSLAGWGRANERGMGIQISTCLKNTGFNFFHLISSFLPIPAPRDWTQLWTVVVWWSGRTTCNNIHIRSSTACYPRNKCNCLKVSLLLPPQSLLCSCPSAAARLYLPRASSRCCPELHPIKDDGRVKKSESRPHNRDYSGGGALLLVLGVHLEKRANHRAFQIFKLRLVGSRM